MPSTTDSADVSSEAVAVVQRYHRAERPVSWGVSLLLGAVVATALFSLSLTPALLVAIGVLSLARLPLLRSHGTIELTTDVDSETARSDFEGSTPPLLAFQWGLANNIRSISDGWAYDLTYLFGLKSVSMEVETASLQHDDEANHRNELEIVVSANGNSWGTYTVDIYEQDGHTEIRIRYESARRFGLRRLPQWLVAERYRDEALSAQGYSITKRDLNLTL